MSTVHLEDVLSLPVAERLHLVEEIRDGLAAHPESLPRAEIQKADVDAVFERALAAGATVVKRSAWQ